MKNNLKIEVTEEGFTYHLQIDGKTYSEEWVRTRTGGSVLKSDFTEELADDNEELFEVIREMSFYLLDFSSELTK